MNFNINNYHFYLENGKVKCNGYVARYNEHNVVNDNNFDHLGTIYGDYAESSDHKSKLHYTSGRLEIDDEFFNVADSYNVTSIEALTAGLLYIYISHKKIQSNKDISDLKGVLNKSRNQMNDTEDVDITLMPCLINQKVNLIQLFIMAFLPLTSLIFKENSASIEFFLGMILFIPVYIYYKFIPNTKKKGEMSKVIIMSKLRIYLPRMIIMGLYGFIFAGFFTNPFCDRFIDAAPYVIPYVGVFLIIGFLLSFRVSKWYESISNSRIKR